MRLRTIGLSACLGLALLISSQVASAQYQITNLVSNQPKAARVTDPLLVNAWGLAYGPGGPFWTSDNGTGYSTLYSANGSKIPLNVVVPSASGVGPGSPTGIVFNGTQDFQVQGSPAVFIFATLDGTISGWAPPVNLGSAIIEAKTTGASYTGLAVSTNASGNFLYAADGANNKVDIFNSTYTLVGSFTDATVPTGFSVYGIQDFNGLLFVSFAGNDSTSGGYIDIFSEAGIFLKRLASGAPLNQPWGFAVAPKNFGALSNTLLISNNTPSGTINAFNSITGQFVGTVKDVNGAPITINQLWGIEFGGGTSADGATNQLFFTAGPNNYLTGTFGVISVSKTD
jgi:uncharacterized protein (TIGR03118 family)